MKILLLSVCSCGVIIAGCLPVSSDRITGRDLALDNPQFAALPASLTIGFAPTPGMKRVFAAAELLRLGKSNGIEIADPRESCFEVPMRKLTVTEAAAAMRQSLPGGVDLAVIELTASEVPAGTLEFQLSGLESTAGAVQIWHGNVRFTQTRKTPVWAKVTVAQNIDAVLTSRDLAPNAPIPAEALHIARWTGPLVRERVAVRLEDVLGRVPKRSIKAGALIPISLLDQAPSVRRGDSVRVEVNSGPTRLTFHAIAEKDSHDGEMVEFRNPATGKTFHARLEGAKAVVMIDAGLGL